MDFTEFTEIETQIKGKRRLNIDEYKSLVSRASRLKRVVNDLNQKYLSLNEQISNMEISLGSDTPAGKPNADAPATGDASVGKPNADAPATGDAPVGTARK